MQQAADLLRCPACGASNPAGAAWCGQCLRRFDEQTPEAPDGRTPATETTQRAAVVHGRFGRPAVATREGAVVWTCPACDAENPIDATACTRCGSSFAAFFDGPTSRPQPRASGGAAVAWSAVLPGAGHWVFRETGPAAARAVIYVWTLAISILLLARPPASGRAVVRGVGAIFFVSAAAVWVLSLLETMRLRDGDRRPLVPPKALTWFAAGLSVVLFVGLLGAAIASRSS